MYEIKDQSRVDELTVAAQTALGRVLAASPSYGGRVADMRMERYWPGKRGGALYEWSFNTCLEGRVKVFGVFNPKANGSHTYGEKDAQIKRGWLTGVHASVGETLLLHSADQDARLPQLTDSTSSEKFSRIIGEHLGDASLLDKTFSPTILSYRPGRRAVVMYRSSASDVGEIPRRFVGKIFRDGRGVELLERHRQVGKAIQDGSEGRVTVIQPLCHIPEWNMLLMPHIGGDTEHKVQSDVQSEGDWAGVLAALHGVDVPGLPAFTERDELMVIDRWLDLFERLCFKIPPIVSAMRSTLALWSMKLAITDIVTTHRDFYPAQIIPTDTGSVLVDLDTLALGSPGIDLGNLACHLLLEKAMKNEGEDPVQLLMDLRSAYLQAGGRVGVDELAFFTITSLLRVGVVHGLRAETAAHAPSLWRHATALLQAYGPPRLGLTSDGPSILAFSHLSNEEDGI